MMWKASAVTLCAGMMVLAVLSACGTGQARDTVSVARSGPGVTVTRPAFTPLSTATPGGTRPPAIPSPGAVTGGDLVARGQMLATSNGCFACHSIDGSTLSGPTWKGLFGRVVTLTTGARVTADEAYLRESILNPSAKVVQGFAPVMPQFRLSQEEVDALIAYIKTLR